MRKLLTIAFVLHAAAALAAAPDDDHLIPEDSDFTRADLPDGATLLGPYYAMVISALKDAFAPDVRARVIAMPSFTPEYAVGIKEDDGAFAIFHLALDAQMWRYDMLRSLREVPPEVLPEDERGRLNEAIGDLQGSLPQDFRDVGVARCEIAIDPDLGRALLRIWSGMLLRTHYGNAGRLGPDGTDYHFSMAGDLQYLAGKVWNPPAESETGRFIRLADTMKSLCVTGDRNLLAQLQPQVDRLLVELVR